MINSEIFKFERTGGPYGDCMSSYHTEMKQPYTMAQFVEMVNAKEEWGKVYINPQNGLCDGAIAE